MKQAGCSGLSLGLESGSNRILRYIDKKFTVDKIIKVSKMISDSGIPVATSVLLGLPDEGKEDIEATLEFMKKVKTDIFDINSFIPLAGTLLYDSISEEEKKNIDWRKVALKSFDNYFSKNISLDDFNRYRTEAYKIANKVRNKTLIRFAAGIFFHFVLRMAKKLRRSIQCY